MMAAVGWRPLTLAYTPSWSYAPSPVTEATGPVIWSSKGPTWLPPSTSRPVSAAATIWPGPCCTDQGCERNAPSPVLGSCDADGLRASQVQHAVQDLDRHVHLSRPTLVRTRAQPVADHPFEAADGGLGQGTTIVAT